MSHTRKKTDPPVVRYEMTFICPKCKWVMACTVPPGREVVTCCFCNRTFEVEDVYKAGKLIPGQRSENWLRDKGVKMDREPAAPRPPGRSSRSIRRS